MPTIKKSTTLYKLTDSNNFTRNHTLWGESITHAATGNGTILCSNGYLHAYEDPFVAVFMNPAHGDYKSPRLWLAQTNDETILRDKDLKCGVKSLTTLRELSLPQISIAQKIAIAIRCALKVYSEPSFVLWANNWFTNKDRSTKSAYAAYGAVYAADAAAANASYAAHAANGAEFFLRDIILEVLLGKEKE